MQLSDFDYFLPEQLIAQHPPAQRGQSRLLHVTTQKLTDLWFEALPSLIQAGDVMVFNNTRVIRARLFGEKATGGKIEALVERILDTHTVLAHIRASKAPKPGTIFYFGGHWTAVMEAREGDLFRLRFNANEDIYSILETSGSLPLPPYITRSTNADDDERYQTVYARERGAIAAPTAGLHFTDSMLHHLKNMDVTLLYVTLHVGAGTFQPVRTDNLTEHVMHSEHYQISAQVAKTIIQAKTEGRRIIAVGTTSLRALESAARDGMLQAGNGETDLFITPGYTFHIVDRLLTNFHLPKSTLMMLVSGFAGMQTIRKAYQHAIEQKYRFFSYGDAMLLENNRNQT